MDEPEFLIITDQAAWRAWLDEHESDSDGIWLLLAKKGTTHPTSLTYAQALEESLCSGWIDGQRRSRDAETYIERFTPRRRASLWSKRNIGFVEALETAGRMRERGLAEVERAKADGRWARAYDGPAAAEPPADLLAALAESPEAAALFESLGGQNRYAVLHRVITAPSDTSRANRIAKLVAMLARGETPYPERQAARRPDAP